MIDSHDFIFALFNSSPTIRTSLTSLFVFSCMSASFCDGRQMSSGKFKSSSCRMRFHSMPVFLCRVSVLMTLSRMIAKSNGERGQRCPTAKFAMNRLLT